MKKLFTISITIISLTAFIVVGVSSAGERVMVIEMADSNWVTFIMTPKEIAAQDAAGAKIERRRASRSVNPKKKTATFEMGESGHFVSFPITDKEAATEDAKNVRLEARHAAIARNPKPDILKVELAESGIYIIFPADHDEKDQEIQHAYSQKSQ